MTNPLFELIGYQPTEDDGDDDYPVLESDDDIELGAPLYIKFMSNHGRTDAAQGEVFKRWLDAQGADYEQLTERSFNVNGHAKDLITGLFPDWATRNQLPGDETPEQTVTRLMDEEDERIAKQWHESQIIGAAVNQMAQQIVDEGFPADRKHDLAHWLTWVAVVASHPEMYESLLIPPLDSSTQR